MIHTSAPGKLMLTGEYAVLEGATALVAAVDRRARVQLERCTDTLANGTVPIRSDLPGQALSRVDLGNAEAARWLRGGAQFVTRVALFVLRKWKLDPRAIGSISVASAALRDGPRGAKLGLGSSAAVAVAVTRAITALTEAVGDTDRGALLDLARGAHREAADGLGSGVDVAASTLGGVHAFTVRGRTLTHEPVELPDGVHLSTVWTGEAADTADFLRALEAFAAAHPSRYRGWIDALGETAEQAVTACVNDEPAAFISAIGAYGHAMGELGRSAGLPIVSEPHARVRAIATDVGAAAKPSGAGGGDIAIAVSPSASIARDLEARLEQAGFPLVDASITPIGVSVRQETRQLS